MTPAAARSTEPRIAAGSRSREWPAGFSRNRVACGDCLELTAQLPDDCVDVVVTSPPYWGQRTSAGLGVEADPRAYVDALLARLGSLRRVLKPEGLLWVNLGDSYNTPVNWRQEDHRYSSLGPAGIGLPVENSAYAKPRHRRRSFEDASAPWLRYGNLLALPYRLTIGLCDLGFLFRGEVIWKKTNPMPEGRCRRPHRAHEGIYLFAKHERHAFQVAPPSKSIWEFPNERTSEIRHYSRFPVELPRRCIAAYGRAGDDVLVLDPFSGSATSGAAALGLGCSFLGFEIDPELAAQSNDYLATIDGNAPRRGRRKPRARNRDTG